MNVANILPGDEVAVELRYTELLTPHDAVYGFVFPTVVGPRYNSPQGAAAGEKWVATPHLPAGVPSPSAFEIKVTLDTPVPVKEIASRSHEVRIERGDGGPATVTLAPGVAGNDRDFLLDYRLAGDRVEAGLMLFRGESENFFLALVEPPKAIAAAEISPRDYIFVVDISGSMHGYPLETSKALLERLIGVAPAERHLQRDALLRLATGCWRRPRCPPPAPTSTAPCRPSGRWAAAAAPRSCRRCAGSRRCRRRRTCRAA